MTLVDNDVAPASATDALARVHRHLRACRHLRPCPEVDALFHELVRMVVEVPPATPARWGCASAATASDLRRLCAEGETQMERAWARRIAVADDPDRALADFPYAENYRRLVRLEVDVLGRTVRRRVAQVAFVGAGPLPLSALYLARMLGAPVDAVDRDPAATAEGRLVAAALGDSATVSFVRADATDVDFRRYDVVVLAALVGGTPAAKRGVLAHLGATMAPGAVLLARSARAARTLLYPPVDAADLGHLRLQTVVHPVDDVVNSVVVARVPGEPHSWGGS